MKSQPFCSSCLTIFLLVFFIGCNQPIRTGYVEDRADLLTDAEEKLLSTALKSIEDAVGSQVMVFTITDLEGEKIEEYSMKQTERIRPGRPGYNDGIIITLSHYDRQVRIELGYGLECLIPDYETSRIIQFQMIPKFAGGDFYGGLDMAIHQIDSILSKNKNKIGRCKYNPNYDQENDLILTQ